MTETKPTIPGFFKGRDVFITGGTGFMGKVLIEKLLRSCGELNRIFMLIRNKKTLNGHERIEKMLQLPLFDRLRNENPDVLKKIIPINGDVTALQLGLSAEDIALMSNVSIIFHAAASVRFDDSLKDAIMMNTRGTRELLVFAEQLKQIKSIVHVSTTYCNPDFKVIEEQIYPPKADWRTAIKMAEQFDEELIDVLTLKYTNYAPNTYTFTKSLAEQIVKEYGNRLPIIIYRPSIVISTLDEPMPGWIDNFNGPAGLLTACALGIYRTAYGDPDVVSDFTPVDTSIKAMIIAAWKLATDAKAERLADNNGEKVNVYNCSTSIQRAFTTGFILQMGETLSSVVPLGQMLWKPGGHITKYRLYNYVKVLCLHILPALLVDTLIRCTGGKPFLTKLQRRIYGANLALHYFMTTNWKFKNDRFLSLNGGVLSSDAAAFQFDNFITADIRSYFLHCMHGARRYLLHEKDEDLPKAITRHNRLAAADRIIKTILILGLAYVFFIKLGVLPFIFGY